jgi:uncharacterized membrane protein
MQATQIRGTRRARIRPAAFTSGYLATGAGRALARSRFPREECESKIILDGLTGLVNRSIRIAVRRSSKRILGFIGVSLAAAATAFLSIGTRGPVFISVSGSDSVTVPTDTLGRGKVRFYSYRDRAGEELRFILGRDSGGQVHAAMDACQRCYRYHKGYVSSRGYLVCKFCGNRYKLGAMEAGLASCVPVKLPIQIAGQRVKIRPADLEHERGLF